MLPLGNQPMLGKWLQVLGGCDYSRGHVVLVPSRGPCELDSPTQPECVQTDVTGMLS